MKDYNLIKYIGKKIGYCHEDKTTNTVQINFTYKGEQSIWHGINQ